MMTRAGVREKLHAFISTELIMDPDLMIGDDEALITGGLIDSFSLAYIAVFVECSFGVYIPDTELTVENMDTLAQMVDRVMREMGR